MGGNFSGSKKRSFRTILDQMRYFKVFCSISWYIRTNDRNYLFVDIFVLFFDLFVVDNGQCVVY